jgi:hypothetical protein
MVKLLEVNVAKEHSRMNIAAKNFGKQSLYKGSGSAGKGQCCYDSCHTTGCDAERDDCCVTDGCYSNNCCVTG